MKIKVTLLLIFCTMLANCSFKEDQPPKVVEVPEKKTDAELSNELFDAVLKKDYKSVEAIIAAGTDLEQYDSQGNTVLIRAVQMRDAVLVEMLLKANAKPFGSTKENPKETAYSKIHKDDTEIQKIFDQKVSLMTEAIAKNLSSSKFDETLSIIKENNIPLDFPMAHQILAEYPFVFITESTDRAEKLLKYLIEGRSYEKLDVLKNQQRLLIVSNAMQNQDFFSYIIDIIVNVKIAKIQSTVIVDTSTLQGIKVEDLKIEDSVYKPNWLAEQIEVISAKESVIINFDYLNDLTQRSITSAIENNTTSAIQVYSSFLKLNFPNSHKNSFTEDILNTIYTSSVSQKSELVLAVLSSWKKANIEKSGFSLDKHTENILNIIIQENASENLYIEIVTALMLYTTDKEATSTLNKMLTLSVDANIKSSLVTYTLSYLARIPKGAFGSAINNSDLSMLGILTNSQLPFDPSEQIDAILHSITQTKTGDLAKSYLLALKQSGLRFDNEMAAKAFLLSLDKLLKENDLTYAVVVDFLISLPDTPINSLSDDEKATAIWDLIKASIATSGNWSRINDFLLKCSSITKNVSFESDLSLGNENVRIKSSLPWFFILYLFEEKKNSTGNFNNLLYILRPLLKIFADNIFSMSVAEAGASINQQLFTTQQMLPLSLLLWSGKDNIERSLKENYSTTSSSAQTLTPVGYESLANNELYKYLSTDREFWEKIIKEIITNQKVALQSSNPSSMYDLMKVVIGSSVLDSVSGVDEILSKFNVPVLSSDTECRFENVSDSEIQGWTTIGSFVVIEPLLKKSCSGKSLTQKESNFFKDFASKHIEEDVTNYFYSSIL